MKSITIYSFVVIQLAVLIAQDEQKLDQATRLVSEGKNDSALVILKKLAEINDKDPQVNYLLGTVALHQGDYDAAIDYLDNAIAEDDSNYLYYHMLGNAYSVKAQNSGTLKAMIVAPKIKENWAKALELKPDFMTVKISLFQYYLNAPGIAGGDDDLALDMANSVLNENGSLGNLMLASYYFSAEEDIPRMEKYLQKALTVETTNAEYRRINEGNANLLNILGYHYMQQDDIEKSRVYFQRAIESTPSNANPYDSMGDFYVKIAKYDSALVYYELALGKNPGFAASLLNRGKMLEKLGRRQEAIESYEKLIHEQPQSHYAEDAQDRLDEINE